MNNNSDAILSLLKDPDNATFEAMVESMTFDIPTLENLWQQADDEIAISRLDWLIHHTRFNQLAERLSEWRSKNGGMLEGVWLAASYQYPELAFAEIDDAVTCIAKDVWLELRDDMTPQEKIAAINRILFGKYGFKSDKQNRTSINNMLLNNVLRTRKANHLAMLILYVSVAEKLKIPLSVVTLFRALRVAYMDDNAPDKDKGIAFYIEPFEKGLMFDHDIAKLTITRQGVPFDPKYIQICTNNIIIRGFLIEMMMLYAEKGMRAKAEDMAKLQTIFNDSNIQ